MRERNRAIIVRFRVIGIEFERLIEVADGAFEFAFFCKCESTNVERFHIIGIEFEGLVEGR